MGTGASTANLPPEVDKPTAKLCAGDRFDDAAFEKAANKDGTVPRSDFLAAIGAAASSSAAAPSNSAAAASSHATTTQGKLDADMSAVALSLSREKRGDQFLGCEVKAATDMEEKFNAAWIYLNVNNCEGAIGNIEALLLIDKDNEKYYYTRAVAYARLAKWQYALADYSAYVKLTKERGNLQGPALANALYGRALCFSKLGHRVPALKDLNECIRVGPEDEQLTEENTSLGAPPRDRSCKPAGGTTCGLRVCPVAAAHPRAWPVLARAHSAVRGARQVRLAERSPGARQGGDRH